MSESFYIITFGHSWLGYGLQIAVLLTGLGAAVTGWRQRRLPLGSDQLLLLGAAMLPIAWVLVMPQHTVIHATFMVRIFVATIALAPLALVWPLQSNSGKSASINCLK